MEFPHRKGRMCLYCHMFSSEYGNCLVDFLRAVLSRLCGVKFSYAFTQLTSTVTTVGVVVMKKRVCSSCDGRVGEMQP